LTCAGLHSRSHSFPTRRSSDLQECFRGNTVNSWDGVKREHDVNQANSDQGDEQWRQGQLALLRARFFAVSQLVAVVARGYVDNLAQPLDDQHVVRVGLFCTTNLINDQL